MHDIDESVLLIHEHVKPQQVNIQYDDKVWFANIIEQSQTIFNNSDNENASLPCLYLWKCVQHGEYCCQDLSCVGKQKNNTKH